MSIKLALVEESGKKPNNIFLKSKSQASFGLVNLENNAHIPTLWTLFFCLFFLCTSIFNPLSFYLWSRKFSWYLVSLCSVFLVFPSLMSLWQTIPIIMKCLLLQQTGNYLSGQLFHWEYLLCIFSKRKNFLWKHFLCGCFHWHLYYLVLRIPLSKKISSDHRHLSCYASIVSYFMQSAYILYLEI